MRGDCCSTVGAAVDRRGSATGRKAVIRKRLRKSRVSAPITESQFGCHGKCPRPASALAATKCRNPALRPNARQHHRASFQRRRGIPPAARAAGVSGSPRGGICVLPRLLLPGPLCRSGGLTRPQLRPEPCAMAALCRHTRSLQVVWRPSWIAAPTVWRIRRLQLSRERQRLAQPLVLDNRAGRHRLDLVEHPERQRGTFVSDSKKSAPLELPVRERARLRRLLLQLIVTRALSFHTVQVCHWRGALSKQRRIPDVLEIRS
jgi:hypothetical protein